MVPHEHRILSGTGIHHLFDTTLVVIEVFIASCALKSLINLIETAKDSHDVVFINQQGHTFLHRFSFCGYFLENLLASFLLIREGTANLASQLLRQRVQLIDLACHSLPIVCELVSLADNLDHSILILRQALAYRCYLVEQFTDSA